jgi:hypothetical protein
VDDEAEVGLVEAHAQRGGGHERLDRVRPQRLLGVLAVGVVEPSGVRADVVTGVAQQRRRLLRGGDGQRVDDAAAREVAEVRGQPGQPGAVGGQPEHAEPQRVPRQGTAHGGHLHPAGAELLGDVGHHPLVGRRRRRQDGCSLRQLTQQVADPAVVGAEVVAPVGDAVRLVDDQQAAAADQVGQLLLAEARVGQPLRGDEQDVDLVGGQPGGDVVPLRGVGAGDLHGPDPGARRGGDLVAHEREQRADQQGRACAPAPQQRRGHEVDGRLPPAGALDDQRPLRPLDQGGDRSVLPLPEDGVGTAGQLPEDGERLAPDVLGQLGGRQGGAGCRAHGSRQ